MGRDTAVCPPWRMILNNLYPSIIQITEKPKHKMLHKISRYSLRPGLSKERTNVILICSPVFTAYPMEMNTIHTNMYLVISSVHGNGVENRYRPTI